MVEVQKGEMNKIAPLFKNVEDTGIDSCLQGHMGKAWTTSLENPVCAMIQTGDFCYFAGAGDSEEGLELVRKLLELTKLECAIVIAETDKWGERIQHIYGEACQKFERYRLNKQGLFNTSSLQTIVDNLGKDYTLQPLQGKWYEEVLKEEWSKDFVSVFSSQEDYEENGIGYIITQGGTVISGASSYTVYDGGIEIEIGTKEDYRKQGLARVAGAALILACIKKGIYPNWDAANKASVRLAQQLGYEYGGAYIAYRVYKV